MNVSRRSLSTRHIIDKTVDRVKITINSRRHIGTLLFGIIWLLFWTNGFLAVSILWSTGLLGTTGILDPKLRGSPVYIVLFCAAFIFMLLMLMIGSYGVFVILKEIAGKEQIALNKNGLIVAFLLFGWKNEKKFPVTAVEEITVRDTKLDFFQSPFTQHYRYAFELKHSGKTHHFGFKIKEDEAKEIISALQSFTLLTQ